MTVFVALLTIKIKVVQRLMNTKTARKSIDVNVRFRIREDHFSADLGC
jgi:hypothetical protein